MSTTYTECAVESCTEPAVARGWCNPHYQRWYSHGDPEWAAPTPEQNFWAKVYKTDTCWLWTGPLHSSGRTGYGWTGRELAHRAAYEYARGPIPDGLQLDHLCRIRLCVNPDHLEPVTARVNVLRSESPSAITARTGVCRRGHTLTAENTYTAPGDGSRRCMDCVQLRKQGRAAA